MKRLPAAIKAALDSEVAHLSMCFRITRTDGVVEHYINNTRPLTFAGETWAAAGGFDATAFTNSVNDNTGNVDLSGFFTSSAQRAAMVSGVYDHARVEIFSINREQPPLSIDDETVLWLFTGYIGNAVIKPDGHGYTMEARGLIQMLQQNVGSLTSGVCRAEFGSMTGDEPCGLDPAAYTVSATVESVSMNRLVKAPLLTQVVGHFTGGKLTWTTGQNAGRIEHVAEYAPGFVSLLRPALMPIAPGDAFSVVAGCDHTIGTCAAKFNNAINFQGEPFLPGFDPWFARGVL